MMNLFQKLIEKGKIRSRDDLKRYYRIFAIKIHPDLSRDDASHAAFIKLRDDYEKSIKGFLERSVPKTIPTREDIYQAFWDIAASGFPVDISIRNASALYIARIDDFSEALKQYGAFTDHDFFEVEKELYRIRGDDIIDNPLFGKIRMIFYNLVTWHLGPKKFTKSAIEKWFAEISGELLRIDCPATRAFLTWLVADLENGGALTSN